MENDTMTKEEAMSILKDYRRSKIIAIIAEDHLGLSYLTDINSKPLEALEESL